ncbi:MAG TPA: type IV toxin-antitoxin system AbiEi family antitoxin domain-containing protein [Capillimicrobium sp.]|nr:type IV toxin-antitoxin system AbiEi family antitoxin domain-containing protein [Capillimicrobium sp.]
MAAALADRQDGAVATRQLELAGVHPRAVSRWRADGTLHPLLHGVHAVGHPRVTRRGWWQAALLASGPDAVLSHRSAAELWGVLQPADGPIHVTVPGATGRKSARVRVHTGRLEPRDVVVRNALPVTTVERMLLDLAEELTVGELVEVLDRCEAARLHRPRAVADVMARARGRRGLRRLREALLVARPQDFLTRSRLERRALRLIADHGLPRPEVNTRLHGYEADLLWRDAKLVVELDGRAFHGDGVAFERDRRRDANLQAAGFRVLRFTWRQVASDGAWVADRIATMLTTDDDRPNARGPRRSGALAG